MRFSYLSTIFLSSSADFAAAAVTPRLVKREIVHPGLLHTNTDFTRIKALVEAQTEPWYTGWQKLTTHADPNYVGSAQVVLCRGTGRDVSCKENYASLYRDAASAYANAIYWKLTGDTTRADAAARVLDLWSSTLTSISGSSDKYLASGLYGYQLANAAEILRDYEGWTGLDAMVAMLNTVFYPMNHRFFIDHNDAKYVDHYWANWDLAQLNTMYAIGVLSDNSSMMDEAITYFKTGAGNGAITKTIWALFTEEGSGKMLGQNQEAGRDQGHATLDFALLGPLAQSAWNQGEDLFGYLDNLILAGSEYMAKYNLFYDVPYKTYVNSDVTQVNISAANRGVIRPMAELLYAHYDGVKGLNASWTGAYRDMVVDAGSGAEGGGGDYGSNSGGYDQLGHGTLMYRVK